VPPNIPRIPVPAFSVTPPRPAPISSDFDRILTSDDVGELVFILWNLFRGECTLLTARPKTMDMGRKATAIKRLSRFIYRKVIMAMVNGNMAHIANLLAHERKSVEGWVGLGDAFDGNSAGFPMTPSFSTMDPGDGDILLLGLQNISL
jgi:hypothetical protein